MSPTSFEILDALGETPFGNVIPANREASRFSHASSEACARLLGKALVAVQDGDAERVDHYVQRAARRPFDHHEEAWPILREAHMLLFGLAVDLIENAAEDDETWLDVLIEVMEAAPPNGRAGMGRVLQVIAADYQIHKSEERRIRECLAGQHVDPGYEDPSHSMAARVQSAVETLETCAALVNAAGDAGIAVAIES